MRLLLAEDEPELSRALTEILIRNHYSVDPVYDGLDAYDYGLSSNYDGIILDVMMPGKNGFQVLEQLRAAGIKTPILMLTARSQVEDRVDGLDKGADDYLTKPFAMAELLARVRALTRRAGDYISPCQHFGNLSLDKSNFSLSGPKGSIQLANKEFQMLELLMANPGIVISANQFLDKIWGYDTASEINIVWVNISYLRKKLTGIGSNVVISAIRGLGYRLEVLHDS